MFLNGQVNSYLPNCQVKTNQHIKRLLMIAKFKLGIWPEALVWWSWMDTCSEGCEFESLCRILDGQFSH